jgi:DNA-binding transcriptional ArsR family regulator
MESPVSTVSEHLGELRRAGLVLERRDGRWVSYSLADEASALLDHIWGLVASDPLVRQEERLVRRVRALGRRVGPGGRPPADECAGTADA